MDPHKEKQNQNPKNGYQISEKYWGKNKREQNSKWFFREGGIQNLTEADEKWL
jgi:hypothetical protein